MKKIKRLIGLILSVAISALLACFFAACDNSSTKNSNQSDNQGENQSVDQGGDENENQGVDQGGDESENQSDEQGKTYGVKIDSLEVYELKEYSDGTTEKEVLTSGSKVETYSAVFSYPDFVLTFNDETNVTITMNYDGEEYFVTFTAEYTIEEGKFVFTDCSADKEIEGSAQDLLDRFNFTSDGTDILFDFCAGKTTIVTDEATDEYANSYGYSITTYSYSYSITTYISGKLLDMSAHTHSYETKHDSNMHWQACTVCGYKADEESHTYEKGACTVCGALKYVGKAYGISEGSFEVYTITEYSDGTTETETLTSGSTYDAMATLLVYPSLTLEFVDETNVTFTFRYNILNSEYTIEISAEYTLNDGKFVFTNISPEGRENIVNAFSFYFDGENVTFDYASTSTSSDADESGIYVVGVTSYAVGAMYVVN